MKIQKRNNKINIQTSFQNIKPGEIFSFVSGDEALYLKLIINQYVLIYDISLDRPSSFIPITMKIDQQDLECIIMLDIVLIYTDPRG